MRLDFAGSASALAAPARPAAGAELRRPRFTLQAEMGGSCLKLEVALIGCGGHAGTHAEAIQASSFARLVACADLDEGRARKFAQRHGIPASYGALAPMLRERKPELLIIAAFPTAHPPLVREAVSHGVQAILCEKPLALNASQAREIAELSERTGALIAEGLMYRSHPQIAQAKRLVAEGSIGAVRYIHAQFTDYESASPDNWRNNRALGGGSMTAKGCYLVDVCNEFAGARARAAFAVETVHPVFGVEIGVTGTILYENGVTAQFETNHRSVWREEIRICGTKGTLRIPHAIVTKAQPREFVLERDGAYEARPMRVETFAFEAGNSYAMQLHRLYRCIREGGEPPVPLADSCRNYRVTDALMRSAASGRLEPVEWDD
jgi:predicted dehydrogenase